GGGAAHPAGPRGPTHPPAGRAVRRRAAAGGAGPRAFAAPAPAARRRAHREPRHKDRARDARPVLRAQSRVRHDDPDRHAQRRAGPEDAPPAAHGRRADRGTGVAAVAMRGSGWFGGFVTPLAWIALVAASAPAPTARAEDAPAGEGA